MHASAENQDTTNGKREARVFAPDLKASTGELLNRLSPLLGLRSASDLDHCTTTAEAIDFIRNSMANVADLKHASAMDGLGLRGALAGVGMAVVTGAQMAPPQVTSGIGIGIAVLLALDVGRHVVKARREMGAVKAWEPSPQLRKSLDIYVEQNNLQRAETANLDTPTFLRRGRPRP